MLLFIVLAHTQKLKGANFNTSHVTVYRGATITRTQSGKYFNTSHVTVYRIPDTDEAFEMVFQYISCYCLSNSIQPLKSLFVKFQYISCYCLSDLQIFLLHCLRNFNTSHVTVYRFCFVPAAAVRDNFNTSHVTVYQSGESKDSRRNAFQYISCYCLSICGSFRSGSFQYFNTSHVTVYLNAVASARMSDSFQYISCYCLSVVSAVVAGMILYFNTSHVTVYRFLVCI